MFLRNFFVYCISNIQQQETTVRRRSRWMKCDWENHCAALDLSRTTVLRKPNILWQVRRNWRCRWNGRNWSVIESRRLRLLLLRWLCCWRFGCLCKRKDTYSSGRCGWGVRVEAEGGTVSSIVGLRRFNGWWWEATAVILFLNRLIVGFHSLCPSSGLTCWIVCCRTCRQIMIFLSISFLLALTSS